MSTRRTPRATRPEAAAELEEQRRALRTIGMFGSLVWPSFMLLDLFMVYVVLHRSTADLLWLLACRVVGQACIGAGLLMVRRPGASDARLLAAELTMVGGGTLGVSLMAIVLGGLQSAYMHGISVVVVFRMAFLPARWRRSLSTAAIYTSIFPLTMGLASLFEPDIRASFASVTSLASFASNYIFVITVAFVGVVGSDTVWALRRQVFEARKLGRYRLTAPIGSGGMGEVWLAWDETLKRNVALKIRRGEEARSDHAARFEREALAVSRLRSPHTIQVYDFGVSDDGIQFIAMEYLVGADLATLVDAHGPMPAARVLRFARQIVASIIEAHDAGIVHRDIKPANIFVTRVGDDFDHVKLLDFGIAKVTDLAGDATQTQGAFIGGTPSYMAPEVCAGGVADVQSDLYAIGATLYFLLAGRPPHTAENVPALFVAHMTVDPEPPSRYRPEPIEPALEAVVMRCLRREPGERFCSARELLEALDAMDCAAPWSTSDAERFWSAFRPNARGEGRATRTTEAATLVA